MSKKKSLFDRRILKREVGAFLDTDPQINEHGGRIVKSLGDGLLLEFTSVVEATQCALDIQQGMAARNVEVPNARRITFRIGVNVGDIIRSRHRSHHTPRNNARRQRSRRTSG